MKTYTKEKLIKKARLLHVIALYSKIAKEREEALAILGSVINALDTKPSKWGSMRESYQSIVDNSKYLTSDKVKEIINN